MNKNARASALVPKYESPRLTKAPKQERVQLKLDLPRSLDDGDEPRARDDGNPFHLSDSSSDQELTPKFSQALPEVA